MAKLNSAKTEVTVQKGDTLSQIAEDYKSYIDGSFANNTERYNHLAKINDVDNPDLIIVGQTIKLTGSGSSSSSSTADTSDQLKVKMRTYGLRSYPLDTRDVLAVWRHDKTKFNKKVRNITRTFTFKHYEYVWVELTRDGTRETKSTGTATDKNVSYAYSDNAEKVFFKVRPVYQYQSGGGGTSGPATYASYNGEYISEKTFDVIWNPEKPSAPSLTYSTYTNDKGEVLGKLTATVSGLDKPDETGYKASTVYFDFYKNGSEWRKNQVAKVDGTGTATIEITDVPSDSTYKVKCRRVNTNDSHKYSEYSDWSTEVNSGPGQMAGFTKCAFSEHDKRIYLEWEKVASATEYEIRYVEDNDSLIDNEGDYKTITVKDATSYSFVVETGKTFYLKIRSKNSDGDVGGWSAVSKAEAATVPNPPTTWSSTTTAIVGDKVNLYWIHNSEDGSEESAAQIKITVESNGVKQEPTYVEKKKVGDTNSFYELDTTDYPEGVKIYWQVRTAGLASGGSGGILDTIIGAVSGESSSSSDESNTKVLGEWSTERIIDIYAVPELILNTTDTSGEILYKLKNFPISISANALPLSQQPLSYYVEIVANQSYTSVDIVGNTKYVNKGDVIFAKHYDINMTLEKTISAGDVHLENNIEYTLNCSAAMNSGLIATNSHRFIVEWSDDIHTPNADIEIDFNTLSATIRPYLATHTITKYKVNSVVSGMAVRYIKTDEILDHVMYPQTVANKVTTTDEQVYEGQLSNGVEVYFCEVSTEHIHTDYLLSVYRREYDGTLTPIAIDMDAANDEVVNDPHPALDCARYRIVAVTKDTGTVSYYDTPDDFYTIGEKALVVQSNEMIKLPYNIDISYKNTSDVSLIEYIGRRHPVSYYGTQVGESQSWSTTIPAYDKDTLNALRRLQVWMDNVYVREPSGTGYWANITVSFSTKHRETTIPVSLEITRVEGGK